MNAARIESPPTHLRRPARLLLIEDDDALRHFLAGVFRRDGFEVTQAATGAQLFDVIVLVTELGAASLLPDVVVTDLRLPDCAGFAVLAHLRRAAAWRMPIIAMSSFAGALDQARARAMGADAVFRKPFELDEMRAMLRKMLEPPPPPSSPSSPPPLSGLGSSGLGAG